MRVTYSYKCTECAAEFTELIVVDLRDFLDEWKPIDSHVRCPECGSKDLKRVYKPIPVHYNAKGFYSTGG